MKKRIQIEGMSCGHCTRAVENTLTSIDGIITATADLAKKEAVITLSQNIADQTITHAIEEEGYLVIKIVSE